MGRRKLARLIHEELADPDGLDQAPPVLGQGASRGPEDHQDAAPPSFPGRVGQGSQPFGLAINPRTYTIYVTQLFQANSLSYSRAPAADRQRGEPDRATCRYNLSAGKPNPKPLKDLDPRVLTTAPISVVRHT